MHIGELAQRTAVNVQTIRFYERQGLLPRAKRNQAGYRCYDSTDLDRVSFVRRNQELGFSLAEIKQLIDLHRAVAAIPKPLRRKPRELQGIIALGQQRLGVVNQKIRTLQNMRRQLLSLIGQLQSPVIAACPVSHNTGSGHPKRPEKSS